MPGYHPHTVGLRCSSTALRGWLEAFFAFGYVLFFAISWVPGYLEQTYGMNLTTIGWFTDLLGGYAAAFGALVIVWSQPRLWACCWYIRTTKNLPANEIWRLPPKPRKSKAPPLRLSSHVRGRDGTPPF